MEKCCLLYNSYFLSDLLKFLLYLLKKKRNGKVHMYDTF